MPTDIVFQGLMGQLRYKMSLLDVAEFFLLRGFEFTHKPGRCLDNLIKQVHRGIKHRYYPMVGLGRLSQQSASARHLRKCDSICDSVLE